MKRDVDRSYLAIVVLLMLVLPLALRPQKSVTIQTLHGDLMAVRLNVSVGVGGLADTGVAELSLNPPDVSAAFKQPGREGVPRGVIRPRLKSMSDRMRASTGRATGTEACTTSEFEPPVVGTEGVSFSTTEWRVGRAQSRPWRG